MKNLLIVLSLFALSYSYGQSALQTKTAQIEFFSKTPAEDIYAKNSEASALLDPIKGDVAFSLSITSFKFEKKLMEEHFNENYLESEKFPKSTFSGKISNIDKVDFTKDGKYESTISGNLTLHGVSKAVTAPVSFEVYQGKILARCDFKVLLVDYKIKVPKIVTQNIAEEIEIHVASTFDSEKK